MTMIAVRISRAFVALASAIFGVVALSIWTAPEAAAARLGLQISGAGGHAALRSEIGGLFAGLSLLCGLAAWKTGRAWPLASGVVVAAIVIGRSIGWLSEGIADDAAAMAIELALLAALLILTNRGNAGTAAGHLRWPRSLRAAAVTFLVLAAGGIAGLLNPGVQRRVFETAAQARAADVNTAPLEDDALRVAVCGSSAPLPSAARAKACVAVFAGGRFYIVDVGPESVENLVLWGVPLSAIGGVMLTHFHSDHIGDLGELNLQTWAAGRPGPLPVHGGPGIEQVVGGFNDAYRLDQGYRTEHHTARLLPPASWPMVARPVTLEGAPTAAKDRSAIVLDEAGLRVTAFEVDHAPIEPAFAYRFTYKDRSVVVTGDLKFHPPLVKAAQGADLMVSEAIAVQMTRALGAGARSAGRDGTAAIMHDIEDYHITPEQAAAIANEAGVKLLALYHLLPAPDGFLARRVFADGISKVRSGGWTLADDGALYTLPIGSNEVRVGRIGE
jgi:ribonuclease Z